MTLSDPKLLKKRTRVERFYSIDVLAHDDELAEHWEE